MGCMGCKSKVPGGISHEPLSQPHEGCVTGKGGRELWQAGKDVPGTRAALLECQPFAGVRHSSAHLWMSPERRARSSAWMLLCLEAQVPDRKQRQERAQLGSVPGLRHPELLNTVLLCSCELSKNLMGPIYPKCNMAEVSMLDPLV